MHLARAEILHSAGRNQEAKKAFQSVLADKNAAAAHRARAQEALASLGKND